MGREKFGHATPFLQSRQRANGIWAWQNLFCLAALILFYVGIRVLAFLQGPVEKRKLLS